MGVREDLLLCDKGIKWYIFFSFRQPISSFFMILVALIRICRLFFLDATNFLKGFHDMIVHVDHLCNYYVVMVCCKNKRHTPMDEPIKICETLKFYEFFFFFKNPLVKFRIISPIYSWLFEHVVKYNIWCTHLYLINVCLSCAILFLHVKLPILLKLWHGIFQKFHVVILYIVKACLSYIYMRIQCINLCMHIRWVKQLNQLVHSSTK